MPTKMNEAGLEDHIEAHLLAHGGYIKGQPTDYDREHGVDLEKLFGFLRATQEEKLKEMGIERPGSSQSTFLFRLRNEITARGMLDVLLKGLDHQAHHLDLFYGTPSPENTQAVANFKQNVFSLTRQLKYCADGSQFAVDMAVFVNGLPFATFELKNNLTAQTYDDAVRQYKDTRSPKETLFKPGHCAVHIALDESQAYFCTELKGKDSWFLPFNKGYNDGAGNPPNPHGFRTSYLWEDTFSRDSLTDIIEHYARRVSQKDLRTGKKTTKYIWPRYHQLEAVRSLLADAKAKGPGSRYLVQHSAGSGKSYSITWLAHQLINVTDTAGKPMFDTVFVITDRRVLDAQIRNEIKRFTQVKSIVGAVTDKSSQLREFIDQGKRIIISTIQKFPFILQELGDGHRDKSFALVIDEAHSSQGGKTAAAVNRALEALQDDGQEEDAQDMLVRMIQSRRMLTNASTFAFTATPKNKTEELFGTRQSDGSFRPFHSYTMKQAIQEGFIRDVLAHYTTVESYYKLAKTVEEDPEFDLGRSQKKLRHYVESHDKPLGEKAKIMLDHFTRQVWNKRLVGGQARAMVVTDGVDRVLKYKAIFDRLLAEQNLPFRTIVAFSGERDWGGRKVTEGGLNGFSSQEIPEKFREEPFRILIVADKFQTGFDEPLLQTMYVDKALSDVKAVQTLSRLNRAHPQKGEVYVLDFANEAETIRQSFETYYRTTILSEATDVNKLHDLKRQLDELRVYTPPAITHVVDMFLSSEPRAHFEHTLDQCVITYTQDLDEDQQVAFKGGARSFVRLYNFLSALMTFENREWERLSIFLNFLIPKLPTPQEEDMSRGLLETVDLESYRNQINAARQITLEDAEGALEPIPMSQPSGPRETEMERLSQIVRAFNEIFGDVDFDDPDFVQNLVFKAIPERIKEDTNLQHALKQGDQKKIALEETRVVRQAITELYIQNLTHTDDVGKLLKAFSDNPQHQRFIMETVRTMMTPYQQQFIDHPGWAETFELLDDQRWIDLAKSLQHLNVPPPKEVDYDIKGTDNERAALMWNTKGQTPIGLVNREISGNPREIVLMHVGASPDVEKVASELMSLIEDSSSLH